MRQWLIPSILPSFTFTIFLRIPIYSFCFNSSLGRLRLWETIDKKIAAIYPSRKFTPEWPPGLQRQATWSESFYHQAVYFARFLLTQLCTGLPHFLWLFVWWPRSSESTLESPDSSCRSVAISIWMVPRSSSPSPAYSSRRWTVSFWASERSSPLCKSPLLSNHVCLYLLCLIFHCDLVLRSLTSTAASVSSASVPSAALVLLLVVLSAIDAPVNDVSLLFAIDWFVWVSPKILFRLRYDNTPML